MGSFRLLNYLGPNGETRPGILVGGDAVVDLREALPGKPWAASTLAALRAGDVIATGTPSGVGRPRGIFLKPGDTVKIELANVGVLENPVAQGE
jgi:hypothetical protein